ncbi:hypothetical protein SDC9_184183 [bioreactor metagenome]|uniref:Uncharacterized protein n=1 Tax=bioreactor metagenome TaxID=1076179 RepID=A0A645HMI8_9ZZZZ
MRVDRSRGAGDQHIVGIGHQLVATARHHHIDPAQQRHNSVDLVGCILQMADHDDGGCPLGTQRIDLTLRQRGSGNEVLFGTGAGGIADDRHGAG